MLAPLILATLLVGQGAGAPAPSKPVMKTYQFVMFKAGKKDALDSAGFKEALRVHLENLESLWLKQGKAVLLGPMAGAGELRGILVLDTSADEAKAILAADPFIKAGAMVADIRPLMAQEGIMLKPPAFMDLVPYTLGFFKRPEGDLPKLDPAEAKRLQAAHLANNEKMWKEGHLVWAGPFLDNTNLRGLLVFRTAERKKFEAMLNEDALVKAGRLVYELHEALTAKGAFPPPPK